MVVRAYDGGTLLLSSIEGAFVEQTKTETLAVVIRRAILRALEITNGNQKRAAPLLGISQRTLHYQMQKYGIPTANGSQSRKRQMSKYIEDKEQ